MHCTVEDISITKKRITIGAASDEIEKEIQKSLQELRTKSKIPGFRPGKAPVSLIDKKYGKEVEKDTLDRLVPEYYNSILKEHDLHPVSNPHFESNSYERKSDLKLVFTVEVRPPVEGFNYKGMDVLEDEVKVEDDEIDTFLNRLLKSKAAYEPVDRLIELEDLVILDFTVAEQENKAYNDQYIKVGADEYPKEFSDALIGKGKGQEVKTQITFPQGFSKEGLAGKTVSLSINIKEVKSLVTPALDDEFAKDMGHDTLAALKEVLQKNILNFKKDNAAKAVKGEIVKTLVEKYDFPVPESHLESELNALVKNAKSMKEYSEKSEDELKVHFREEAVKNVKAMVLLDIVGEENKIVVSDKELQDRLILMAQAMSMTPEALVQFYANRDGSLEALRYTIFREKAVDEIYSKANVKTKSE
ncbi:MAG: trigger factor [Nitrospirae bacterium]|nr:trigger factor [Nitrospirota bacterium]